MAAQKGADTLPEIIQTLAILVAGLHETASKLQALCQDCLHARPILVKAMGIQRIQTAGLDQRGGVAESIGAGDFKVVRVPEHQLQVAGIVTVDIPGSAGAFTHRAEGQFPQTPQFAHHAGRLGGAYQQDLLAVTGCPQ